MSPTKFLAGVLLLVLCAFTPNLASASNSIDYSNNGGMLTGTNAGLTLTGSILIAVTTLPSGPMINGNLGTVSFTTGALATGSVQMGATFAAGGTFEIDGNGMNGVGNGVLFAGTFSGPVSWTITTLANGTHNYTLTGVLTGTGSFANMNGVTLQLTINTGKGFYNGSTQISGGNTTVTPSVPEPSSLALFGTGALTLAGTLRRRLFAR